MKLLLWLASIALVASTASFAGEVPVDASAGVQPASEAIDPRIAEAEALFAAQKIAELKPLLATLKQQNPPHLAVLFLAGMVANAEEDYAKAADEFRAMLARDPSLIRPRLELALALQKSGDRQAAKYHYQQVLSANLPDAVKRNVYKQLGDIRERLPSLRLSLDLVSDSNPKQATNSRVVIIGGRPFTLNDAGSAKSETGLLVTADASMPLPSNPTWYAHAYGEAYEYPGRELDLLYGEASVGKRFDFGEHSASLEAGAHGSIYQHKELYNGLLARGSIFMRPLPKLALLLDTSVKTYDYPNLSYLSGNLTALGVTSIYVPAPTQRWDFGANVAYYHADEAAYSYTQPGLSARFLQEWSGGWITGLRLQGLVADYDAPDPFFGETRHDKEGRIELDVLNRKIKLWAFSPRLLVGYVKRNSSIELYTYDRTYVRVGLSTEF
jgi:outer membrane protein